MGRVRQSETGGRTYYRGNYRRSRVFAAVIFHVCALDTNLHSPERRLIELRIEHSDLDAMIDRMGAQQPVDELMVRRLKKRRLSLRDEIARIERLLSPDESA